MPYIEAGPLDSLMLSLSFRFQRLGFIGFRGLRRRLKEEAHVACEAESNPA